MSSRYTGSVKKYYRSFFKYVIYDLYHNNKAISNPKYYLFQVLFKTLISRYDNRFRDSNYQLLLKPQLDYLNNDCKNNELLWGFDECKNKGLFGVYVKLIVENKKVYLKQLGNKTICEVDRNFVFHLRDLLYHFNNRYEIEYKRYLGWRKINLRYQTLKSEDKVDEFIIERLIKRLVPYGGWDYVINTNRHISNNERVLFRDKFYRGNLQSIIIYVLSKELNFYHQFNFDCEYWNINKRHHYWNMVDVYSDLIKTFSIPQPHSGMESNE